MALSSFSQPSIENHHVDYWPAAHLNIVSHLGSIKQEIAEKHTQKPTLNGDTYCSSEGYGIFDNKGEN